MAEAQIQKSEERAEDEAEAAEVAETVSLAPWVELLPAMVPPLHLRRNVQIKITSFEILSLPSFLPPFVSLLNTHLPL